MTNQELLAGAGTIGAVVLAGVLAHLVAFWVLKRVVVRDRPLQHVLDRSAAPTRLVVGVLAVLLALPATAFGPRAVDRAEHGLVIVLIAAVAWLLVRLIGAAEHAAMRRFSIEKRDNLEERRKRTQAQILARVGSVLVIVLAAAAVMLTFEQARAVGASVLASAGVAGIVAGIAARSTLGNVIAGLQIAFTEPIRIDDVVVVEGEWGRIEEITLTYVVVRIWDLRRLVLPTTYFVEQPFQNWTRTSAQVLGTVTLFVDYTTPVDEVREEFRRILEDSDKWDGEVWALQVIDATAQTMELRALMSAVDAPTSWDLRCEMRERLLAYLQRAQPGALPRLRLAEGAAARSTAAGDGHPERPGQDLAPLEEARDDP
jgi:small-conductance mechanosensitive channel